MLVTIRSAVLDDVPALLAIEREATSAAHWTREQYERLVESGILLVAMDGSRDLFARKKWPACGRSRTWWSPNTAAGAELGIVCWTNSCAVPEMKEALRFG